jgi:hypothetical protein
MKGPGDEPQVGEIWVADLATGAIRPVATEGKYRSPIFLLDGSILTLKGDKVVHFPGGGTSPSVLQTVKGIDKLVGTNTKESGRVLAVLEDADGRSMPAILSLDDGAISPLPMDWESEEDIRVLAHLRGWERDYGDIELAVQRVRKSGMVGTREWHDVFLIRKGENPKNITNCDGSDCGQPSLSPDRTRVVFIKGED